MSKISHENKKKIARKMMTKEELKSNTPIFQSNAWLSLKEKIKKRVARIELASKKKSGEEQKNI